MSSTWRKPLRKESRASASATLRPSIPKKPSPIITGSRVYAGLFRPITLKVGGSSIKIEPAKITLKSVQIDVVADAKTTVKGAMVDVNGSAMVTVKGGLVKIN